ncbi:hypothetical protein T06_768 [Trichinella sp. T6]|nr:hypothetical protein T06_768 [Trichinella sp. T6]
MTDPLLATIHCPKPTLLSEILLCLCCDTPAHPKSTMCFQLNSGRLIFHNSACVSQVDVIKFS